MNGAVCQSLEVSDSQERTTQISYTVHIYKYFSASFTGINVRESINETGTLIFVNLSTGTVLKC